MQAQPTLLQRAITTAFALVIAIMFLFVPVLFIATNGVQAQAEVLNARLIAGQAAYALAASEADDLRDALLDAATNPDKARAANSLHRADELTRQFPEDGRKMTAIFCPLASKSRAAIEDLNTTQCSPNSDEVAKSIGTLVDSYGSNASAYDFNALSAASELHGNKKADALSIINGRLIDEFAKQRSDGEALLKAVSELANSRYNALVAALKETLFAVVSGLAIAIGIVLFSLRRMRSLIGQGATQKHPWPSIED